jgi:hypothetical protein
MLPIQGEGLDFMYHNPERPKLKSSNFQDTKDQTISKNKNQLGALSDEP